MTSLAKASNVIAELVAANHILFDQGVVDGFGHVSIRHGSAVDRFLLARSIAPALVTADDILEFDLDGNPLNGEGQAVYLERFIHSEIYRVRPDVGAVVHSHSPAVIPFSVVNGVPLRAVWHLGAILGEGCPVFEIRTVAGRESDLLIRDRALGAASGQIARARPGSADARPRMHRGGPRCAPGGFQRGLYGNQRVASVRGDAARPRDLSYPRRG